jgi:formylglycine-generating enzyme required for sulfatase activity/TolB-like protein
MKKFLLILILFMLVFINLGQSAEQKRVAVLSPHNKADLPDRDIEYLTDLVRTGALQELPTDRFVVLTKDQIVSLIPVEKRELKNCEGPCELEIGRLIKADYLVTGTILKIEDQLRLTVNLYEVETGNLLDSNKASGTKTLQLEEPIQKLTQAQFGKIPGSKTDQEAKKPSILKQAAKQAVGMFFEHEEKKPASIKSTKKPAAVADNSQATPQNEFEAAAKKEEVRLEQQKQAKMAAQAKLEARYIELKTDFMAIKGLLENPAMSNEAKQAASRRFMEKWSEDGIYRPLVRTMLQPNNIPDGMKLVLGGRFTMGCVPNDRSCQPSELPAHRVTVNTIWMDEHEVTAEEYKICVNTGRCQPAQSCPQPKIKDLYNADRPDRKNHPINGITWNDANNYCRWQGKRLPTEAEFEHALRGPDEGVINPWGNEPTPPARSGNYADESKKRKDQGQDIFAGYEDGYSGTAPVCSFSRNQYELCDLGGNVYEWCLDAFAPDYYATSPNANPNGPPETPNSLRIVRGGSFSGQPTGARLSARGAAQPTQAGYDLGFRCVKAFE